MKIKKRIEKELAEYLRSLGQFHSLGKLSPELSHSIKDFLSRKGKRIRPTLFVLTYLGYAQKPRPGIFHSAIALELLHDFLLVHDDIIDKARLRRGKPSMHAMLERYLPVRGKVKFNGQDLALIAGDVIYCLALHAFLAVREEPLRKEAALKKLIETAVYTASGEFIELLYGLRALKAISQSDIYRIYDLKTASYTFAAPLSLGATLAGAGPAQISRLSRYGTFLGRAFQIKDDILGMFGKEAETGKPSLADIREAKRTILIWYAYSHTSKKGQRRIEAILAKDNAGLTELKALRELIIATGALDYAKGEIARLFKLSQTLSAKLSLRKTYHRLIDDFAGEILLKE
ncbi:MAG: polyprenyl synthetase family protein [Candidatus Omnitrophota bacterium]